MCVYDEGKERAFFSPSVSAWILYCLSHYFEVPLLFILICYFLKEASMWLNSS